MTLKPQACAALLLACSAAFGPAATAQTAYFEGISASLGLALTGSSVRLSVPNTAYMDVGKTSEVTTLDLSYGVAQGRRFLLSTGATIDAGNTKLGKLGDQNSAIEASLRNHYSVYVQPTWLVTPSTGIYGKLGYHRAKLSATEGLDAASDTFNGTGLALGFKTRVRQNVYLQAEALLVDYKSHTYGTGSTVDMRTTSSILSAGYRF